MNESKHTPGPWFHYDDRSSTERHEIVAMGKTVARVYCTNGCEAEDKANARLIAAAPDLLEACEAMLEEMQVWETEQGEHPAATLARAAIAKAKGE